MKSTNAAASPTVCATSPNDPVAAATAVANAMRNQAEMSSIAALARARAPIGRLSMRRSTMMRASTGKAVIDIATPMNRAKATNGLSGPTRPKIGSAASRPSAIGTNTPAFDTATACVTRPRSWVGSSSSPTRNM